MRKYIYITLKALLVVLALQSCSSILDSSSKDILTDPTVWGNKEAIESYLGKLYDQMETENFRYVVFDEAGFPCQLTDEAVRSYTWGSINNQIIGDGGFQWWGYSQVREVNSFIEKIKTSPLSSSFVEMATAEAKFIRAFHYFALVKRYGGMPILTKAQDYTGSNLEELKVPRNTEKEVYEFIKSEIDEIVSVLPEEWDSSNKFRATRYSAYALKSRAMLYAGSIATYGEYDLNGVVGVEAADREYFFKESIKASEVIINSNKYELYDKGGSREENFQNLFLDKGLHSETLFTVAYSAPDKGHNWDFYNAPQSFKVDYGCVTNPTLQLVEEYEYIDGSDGALRTTDESGKPILFDDPKDLFKDKDPRLLATVMTPFSDWQNGYLEIRKGIIDGDKVISASNLTDAYGTGDNKINIIGKDGILDVNDPTKTGFYVKKYMNPSARVNSGRSETNWMVFRYAEILLNYAEACKELNINDAQSLDAINQIRTRAGIKELQTLSLEQVRKERKVELAFENHRWWDMRRWRISTDILNNFQAKALRPYLVWEEGKHPSEMKYIFEKGDAPKPTKTFLPRLYYVQIPTAQIRTNDKLVQNPGY